MAREHIKKEHPELIDKVLSRMSKRKIENLKRRGVDPVNWAAGRIVSAMSLMGSFSNKSVVEY